MKFDSYAITSFGAVILTPTGEFEPQWHAYIEEQSRRTSKDMEAAGPL